VEGVLNTKRGGWAGGGGGGVGGGEKEGQGGWNSGAGINWGCFMR